MQYLLKETMAAKEARGIADPTIVIQKWLESPKLLCEYSIIVSENDQGGWYVHVRSAGSEGSKERNWFIAMQLYGVEYTKVQKCSSACLFQF